jgi:hypothetical protein
MKPYFYKLLHEPTGKYYVGSQYGKTSDPHNLWETYFTSSKYVGDMIENYGKDSFRIIYVKVREDARDYERRYLKKAYFILGKERFLELFLNRNLSPGILLSEETIKKANVKRRISNSLSAKKLLKEGRHNFQVNRYIRNEEDNKKISERMMGNNFGSLRIMDEDLKSKLSEAARGNTNVRGYKKWYNPKTNERVYSPDKPNEDFINKSFSTLSDEGRKKIVESSSKQKSLEHRNKLSISAKNRPSNCKGTIWVVNMEGKRKRVKQNNIPEGYKSVKEKQ